ncbi:uncharacterized protein LOC110426955 [Herrania umbratica]|uniref:Uncharacterized protein LOC110426955 n=1 Tax=Herrania umbratica TaxID=108875 RepID=A0A6J1BFA4_9ROSI|nr:uncharacterized protein LOC110426955 [Herrania umbratica]
MSHGARKNSPNVRNQATDSARRGSGLKVGDQRVDRRNKQRDRRSGEGSRPRCSHCDKIGHTRDDCYEIVGYPTDWQRKLKVRGDQARVRSDRGPRTSATLTGTKARAFLAGTETGTPQECSSLVPGLTQAHIQQLIDLLDRQSDNSNGPVVNMASNVNFSGLTLEEAYWSG